MKVNFTRGSTNVALCLSQIECLAARIGEKVVVTKGNFEEVLSIVGLKLEHLLATLYKNRDKIFTVSHLYT